MLYTHGKFSKYCQPWAVVAIARLSRMRRASTPGKQGR